MATFEAKHMLQLPLYYVSEWEILTGMKESHEKKNLNLFMVQLPIYCILESEILVSAKADIGKTKREK